MSKFHITHHVKYCRIAKSIALVFALAVAIAITPSTSVRASIINVPADQPTIQAGVNAAVNGDTVMVAQGTYTGDGNRDIDFAGKSIVLRAISNLLATTIDCQGTTSEYHRAFYLHTGEDSTTVIDGFTITGAYDSTGAVYCHGTGVKLVHCTIIGNSVSGVRHVPVGSTWKWMVVDGCTITNNTGDGIYVTGGLVMRNCTISHNSGNGLYAKEPSSNSNVSHSIFANNGLAGMGGSSFSGYMAWVTNCTFVGNTDGLACIVDLPIGRAPQLTARVQNCIMAFNTNRGYACGGYVNPGVVCSDAFGNGGKNWNTFNSVPPGGDSLGNKSLDPLFCERAVGNLSLMDASPCSAANNGCGSLI
ncbi:MAG: right-handed parallel beta-helix repeat-containing protein, partial [Candidatus Zixiibacteriota bacterium]